MALDQNAGQKRTVGLARNLMPLAESPAPLATMATAPIATMPTPSAPERKPILSDPIAATEANLRTKKISFLTDPKLEERFRKARLRAGFDKLEDAYNEAIKTFCDQVDAGKIDRF
jgi:hypothetical protein